MIAAENLRVGMRVIRSLPPQEIGIVTELGDKGALTVKFDGVNSYITAFISASHLDELPHRVRILKNYPWNDWDKMEGPISIKEGEPGWEEAHSNWLSGKNPTPDPAWKNGVYFQIVEI